MIPSYIVLKGLGYKPSAPLNQTKGKVDVLVKIEQTAFSLECKAKQRLAKQRLDTLKPQGLTNY